MVYWVPRKRSGRKDIKSILDEEAEYEEITRSTPRGRFDSAKQFKFDWDRAARSIKEAIQKYNSTGRIAVYETWGWAPGEEGGFGVGVTKAIKDEKTLRDAMRDLHRAEAMVASADREIESARRGLERHEFGETYKRGIGTSAFMSRIPARNRASRRKKKAQKAVKISRINVASMVGRAKKIGGDVTLKF
jgi:hypothetical protein